MKSVPGEIQGEEPGRCIDRSVGELVFCLLVLLNIFYMHSKQLTPRKQRQEIMAVSLLLSKDKFERFRFSGKCFN